MELLPHQPEGIDHLLSMPFGKPHALLADEPGTGKTVMAIGAAMKAGCKNGIVLCPPVIKEQWASMMVKWGLAEPDQIQILYGFNAVLNDAPFKILNYELAREDRIRKQFLKRDWDFIIMDEAHRLKSLDSQQTKAVLSKYGIASKCYWKWALSGTIIPNRPIELYPLLRTLAPEVITPYDNHSAYIGHFCGGAWLAGKGASNEHELARRIQPFMLKRNLADVWADYPPLIENDIWLNCADEIVAHPEYATAIYDPTIRRLTAEAKMPRVAEYLEEKLKEGVPKITVFAFHKNAIDILAKLLASYNLAKIYGGMTPLQREKQKQKFLEDPACRGILVQIQSGGEGLDGLQRVCDYVIEAEPEWSPGREDQAIARIQRIGQSNTVFLERIYAASSYEEVIARANKRKRKAINVITKSNGGSFIMGLEKDISRMATALESIASSLAGKAATVLEQTAVQLQQPAPQAGNVVPLANAVQVPPVTTPSANTVAASPAGAAVPMAAAVPAMNASPLGVTAPVVNQPPMQFAPPQAMDLQSFLTEAGSYLNTMDPNAAQMKLAQVNAKYGVQKAGEVNPQFFLNFLADLKA